MQVVDFFYDAMREQDIRWEYQILRCQVCHKEIKGCKQQHLDALDIFAEHIRGKGHQKKVKNLLEKDAWQEFTARPKVQSVWLHHGNGSVWKDGTWRHRGVDFSEAPPPEEEASRTLDWSLWQKTTNDREKRRGEPLTKFLHASDDGKGQEDRVQLASPDLSQGPNDFEAQVKSLRPEAVQLKNKLWEGMVKRDLEMVNLTNRSDDFAFDWKEYLRGIPKFPKALIDEVTTFSAELHRTARCTWSNLPRFHFVATTQRFRILLSQHASRKCVLVYEDRERNFLSVEDLPEDGQRGQPQARYPEPRDQDVVEAFGGNCFYMRKLKHQLMNNGSDSSQVSFRDLVKRFIGSDELVDTAKERNLVEFDGLRLLWKLQSDAVEREWRQFLRSQGTEALKLDTGFTEAVELDRLHDEISRSVQNFVDGPSPDTWRNCCREIRRCSRCQVDFARVLHATDYQQALSHCQWHTWSGRWTLPVDQIYFTHDTINKRFKDGRAVEETLQQLIQDPRKLQDIPPIRVMFYHGKFHSIDNRRLWCFKELAQRGSADAPLSVTVQLHGIAGASRWSKTRRDMDFLMQFFDAFSSKCEGREVEWYKPHSYWRR